MRVFYDVKLHVTLRIQNKCDFREKSKKAKARRIDSHTKKGMLFADWLSASPQHLPLLIILFRKVTKTKASSLHIPKWIQV